MCTRIMSFPSSTELRLDLPACLVQRVHDPLRVLPEPRSYTGGRKAFFVCSQRTPKKVHACRASCTGCTGCTP